METHWATKAKRKMPPKRKSLGSNLDGFFENPLTPVTPVVSEVWVLHFYHKTTRNCRERLCIFVLRRDSPPRRLRSTSLTPSEPLRFSQSDTTPSPKTSTKDSSSKVDSAPAALHGVIQENRIASKPVDVEMQEESGSVSYSEGSDVSNTFPPKGLKNPINLPESKDKSSDTIESKKGLLTGDSVLYGSVHEGDDFQNQSFFTRWYHRPEQGDIITGRSPSGPIKCPQCENSIETFIVRKASRQAWTWAIVLFCLFLWPFCWIPFVIDKCRKNVHKCPMCGFEFPSEDNSKCCKFADWTHDKIILYLSTDLVSCFTVLLLIIDDLLQLKKFSKKIFKKFQNWLQWDVK